MLVGDIIIGARELIPDLPRVTPSPGGAAAAVVASVGSTLPPGTYILCVTFTNQWGETTASSNITGLIVGVNQGIQVTAPSFSTNPSALGMRAYFAQTGQPFLQFQASSSLPFTISSPGTPGTPPNRVTAFYPDSDGNFISAYTMFRWLNEALTTASYVAGGIPDTSGVQMNLNQGMYVMPGIWDKFESCWFDGFPIAFDKRQGMFYRNVLQGIVFVASLQMSSDRQVLEFQPQPDRSGGQTTLSAQVLLPDQTINVTSTASFGPNLGMFSIGAPGASYPNVEICSYGYMSGSQLIGVQRGLGGTAQQAWPNGSQVTELNFRFGGLRIANTTPYVPGMSLATLQVPPGWSRPLIDYLVCKAREGEQSPQESARKLQEFTTFIKGYTTGNKQIAGPRQIGPPNRSGDAYPSASSGGGLIIP